MSYTVGQVVYLLFRDEMKIIPARVVEVVTRHRFNEDVTTSYNILLPGKKPNIVDLSDLAADVFIDHMELKRIMVENATSSIDRMISRAKDFADTSFLSAPAPVRDGDSDVE